ncbi:MAG: 30S ribosomal protein S12 methylthiotransferase RimO [Acidobacteriota bacterium]|nr:30S ribosomal protein S12 methylthiotransferase RimO [Acidobacteriota bacterium]
MNRKTAALISLGCAKNLVDSEVMLGILKTSGYDPVPSPDEADVIIVNTCGFIQPAREESLSVLRKAAALKAADAGKRLVVAGCYVRKDGEALKRRFPEVDAWLDVGDYAKIAAAAAGRPFRSCDRAFLYNHTTPRLISTPRSWAYLKISEGCLRRCGFCTIPIIKGPLRSRTEASIVREAENLVSSGVREIVLVSHDTTSFGMDRGGKRKLPGLLKSLLSIRKLAWIRILYGYPEGVTDELLDMFKDPRICSYLDLPFQHADPAVVRSMGRTMDAARAVALIEKIRSRVPGVALRTSLIVGYPGEGSREFRKLKMFVKEARFDHLGVFPYSPEPGTAAFRLGDPVSSAAKTGRRASLMRLQTEISFERNRARIGSTEAVLVEGVSREAPDLSIGRGRFQAPEVDGVIFIKTGRGGTSRKNPIVNVRIEAADVYDLTGRPAS